MAIQDPIADLLTRIRNAQMVGHSSISINSSTLKLRICEVLQQEGYIRSFEETEGEVKKDLTVHLKYFKGRPVIEEIHRISKPSLRIYKSSEDLPVVRGGLGIAIVSTSKGVMTGSNAKSMGVGGEVLCTVF